MEASKFKEVVAGSTTITTYIPEMETKLIWDIEGFETLWSNQGCSLRSKVMSLENQHLRKKLDCWLAMRNDPTDQEFTSFDVTLRGPDSNAIDYCSYEIIIGQPGSESAVSDPEWKVKPQVGHFENNPDPNWCRYTLQSKIRHDAVNSCEAKKLGYTLRVTVNVKIHFKPEDIDGFAEFPPKKTGVFSTEKWIASLFNTDRLSDVIIRCQGETFLGHKIVLGQSSVLEKMFTTKTKEALPNKIVISDTDPLVFECLLKSMYGVDFELPTDLPDILQMVNCAQKYNILPLKVSCFEKLAGMLSNENAAELAIAAYQFCKEEELSEYRDYFRQYCLNRHKVLIQNPGYKYLFISNVDNVETHLID